MSDKYKYTKDGRKVIVIGKLNSTETIVQEIFVCDGSEIPSGEHFLAKTLHDAPAESWQDKDLRERESRFVSRKAEMDRESERLHTAHNQKKKELQALIKDTGFLAKHIDHPAVSTLLMWLKGEVTHVVKYNWYTYEIKTFADAFCPDKEDRYETRLKLLSLFGSTEGDFEYRVNYYRDGSGGWDKIAPCASYEDAKKVIEGVITKQLSKKPATSYMVKAKAEFGLSVPSQEQVKGFYIKQIEAKKEAHKKKCEELSAHESQMRELQHTIDKL